MDIEEAVKTRRSVRDFLDRPIDRSVLEDVLNVALRAPSGGNLQPWWLHVLTGSDLKALQGAVNTQLKAGIFSEQTEYDIYPQNLSSPYRDRRFEVGEALYGQLGIPREKMAERQRWHVRNFECFGAPVLLFCTIDRSMGRPQWSDLGMLLQTLMLLLRGKGLDSCAQEVWSLFPQTVGQFLNLPADRMLFAGISIGYANRNHPVNQVVTARASLSEIAEFRGF